MLLVDNASYSFILQLENGIPILPYYDNKEDRELEKLKGLVLELLPVEDVRTKIKQYFQWDLFFKYCQNTNLLVKKLMSNFEHV